MKKLAVMLLLVSACSQRESAESLGRSYLTRMYPGQQSTITCMPYDSDHNGYVSCDAIVAGHPIALECGAVRYCLVFCNNDCKLRLPVLGQQ